MPVKVASVKSLATLCANNTAEAHAGQDIKNELFIPSRKVSKDIYALHSKC